MRDRYSFTGDGLHNIAVYGIDPAEVWQVLRAQRRLTRQMSEDANAVFGPTLPARCSPTRSPCSPSTWEARMSERFDQDLSAVIANGADVNLPVPDTDVPMVSRSLRLPVDVDQRIRAAADARGIGATTLMRQFIEAGLVELDDSAVVPLAEVHRALAALARPSRAA